MNITASLFINDDERGLHNDYEKWLEGLAPEKPYSQYQHNGFEDNAEAHLKRTIMGRETDTVQDYQSIMLSSRIYPSCYVLYHM
jgi:thiamine phosphate synthase YjbQ (UPF0047 family)